MRYRRRLPERVQYQFDYGTFLRAWKSAQCRAAGQSATRQSATKAERNKGSGMRTADFNACMSVVTEALRSYEGESIYA